MTTLTERLAAAAGTTSAPTDLRIHDATFYLSDAPADRTGCIWFEQNEDLFNPTQPQNTRQVLIQVDVDNGEGTRVAVDPNGTCQLRLIETAIQSFRRGRPPSCRSSTPTASAARISRTATGAAEGYGRPLGWRTRLPNRGRLPVLPGQQSGQGGQRRGVGRRF